MLGESKSQKEHHGWLPGGGGSRLRSAGALPEPLWVRRVKGTAGTEGEQTQEAPVYLPCPPSVVIHSQGPA